MDVLAIIGIIAAIVGITAGGVQVLDYIQKRRERQVAEQRQPQSSVVVSLAAPHPGSRQIQDPYSAYEIGLRQLLAQLGQDHPRYAEALVYQQRLSENIAETRQHGDTDTQEAERAQVIEQLNNLALSVLGMPFNELCSQTTSTTEPALSPRSILHNLPPRGEFIGRDAEKAQVHQALQSRTRIVSIDGIGGIGKTALALEVAYECLVASRGDIPTDGIATFDGFIWTTARDRELDLNDVLDAVARILEYPGIAQKPLAERQSAVRKLFRTQPYLLVVDSFEMIADEGVRDFLLNLPEPSRALITTRRRDLTEAWMISLEDLKEAEALALIRSEGQRLGLPALERADDRALLPLYRSTQGAPLAIKWAVGQIRQRGQSLDSVLVALRKARADIFESIFAHSWELLSADARRVIAVMPLFAGSASRTAIEAVSDVHNSLLDDALGQLVGMSLVDVTDELEMERRRYSIHPLTRAYAGQAGEAEHTAQFVQDAFERMLTYYRQLVAPPAELRVGVPYWDGLRNYANIQSLEQEWPNLSHLIRRALDTGRDAVALDMFLPVVHLLNALGQWDERLELGLEVCQAANRLGDSSEAWLWIDAVGWIYLQRRQFMDCNDALTAGRSIARQFDLADAMLQADAFEARLYHLRGDVAAARRKIEETLEPIDLDWVLEHGSPVHQIVVSRALAAAGHLSWWEEDYAQARERIECELKLRDALGENVAPILARLGYISLKLNDMASAERSLERATVNAGPKDVALINYSLALIAERKRDWQETRRLCELALEQYTRLGMEGEVRACNDLLARLPSVVNRDKSGSR